MEDICNCINIALSSADGVATLFGRFFAHGLALCAFEEQTGAWRQIAEEHTGKLPSSTVAFVRPGTNQWTILKQHEL
jgi:hypothetical protein